MCGWRMAKNCRKIRPRSNKTVLSSRRRHTRWSRDWSSDVCSSDLPETQEPNPEKALLATVFRLNMSASAAPASVTLEVWQGPTSTSVPARFLVAAAASVPPTPSWVEFDIPDTWLNFSSDHYYIALKNASCALTWWDANGGDRAWVSQSPPGQGWRGGPKT